MEKIQGSGILRYEKARVYLINRKPSVTKKELAFKRAFDLLFSFLIIVFILSWLLPILALIIKLNSRGPVFFIQTRTGCFGKKFQCIKLRTMYMNKEANITQASSNDPRITTIGKFLRFTCIDELPQFFNVFIGDMSTVGPRPHMINDCFEFSKIIRDYNQRNVVKPGITGIAQVKGYRGQTNNFYDVVHRYKWDMFYIRNLSFNLDLRILNLTITSIFKAIFVRTIRVENHVVETPSYHLEASEYLN